MSLGDPTIHRGPSPDGSRGQLQWVHLCVSVIEGLTPERIGDVYLNRGCPGDGAVEGCTTGGGEGGTVSTVVGKREGREDIDHTQPLVAKRRGKLQSVEILIATVNLSFKYEHVYVCLVYTSLLSIHFKKTKKQKNPYFYTSTHYKYRCDINTRECKQNGSDCLLV